MPDPSRPGSMVVFVALPSLLILLTLVWQGVALYPTQPSLPFERELSTADLEQLSQGLGFGGPEERLQKVLTLASDTQRCPEHAPHAVLFLASRLKDPDARIRARVASALGALGSTAAAALPSLNEVQGSGDAQFNRVVAEAVWWIEHGDAVPAFEKCAPWPVALP